MRATLPSLGWPDKIEKHKATILQRKNGCGLPASPACA
jgi:hypothetical protein